MPQCIHGWGGDPSECPQCDVIGREQDKAELTRLRAENEGLRETLDGIGVIVGVTKDSPIGMCSITVAVHALLCRARDVVNCFKKVGGTGGLYLEAPGIHAENALLELRKITHSHDER